MLTFAQSITISRRCIKAVTNANDIVQEDILDSLGVTEGDMLELLKRAICVSESIGVPSKGHTLDIEKLGGIDSGSTVRQLSLTIRDEAVEES